MNESVDDFKRFVAMLVLADAITQEQHDDLMNMLTQEGGADERLMNILRSAEKSS